MYIDPVLCGMHAASSRLPAAQASIRRQEDIPDALADDEVLHQGGMLLDFARLS